MSLFDKIASDLTGRNKGNSSSYSSSGSSSSEKTVWQCYYCGQRCTTFGNSVPNAGICRERGKTVNGAPKPHEWHKVG